MADARVLAPDLAGHGSRMRGPPANLATQAEQLEQLLSAAGVGGTEKVSGCTPGALSLLSAGHHWAWVGWVSGARVRRLGATLVALLDTVAALQCGRDKQEASLARQPDGACSVRRSFGRIGSGADQSDSQLCPGAGRGPGSAHRLPQPVRGRAMAPGC